MYCYDSTWQKLFHYYFPGQKISPQFQTLGDVVVIHESSLLILLSVTLLLFQGQSRVKQLKLKAVFFHASSYRMKFNLSTCGEYIIVR